MKILKSHFWYTKRQRNGVFFFVLLIVLLQLFFNFYDFTTSGEEKIQSIEITLLQTALDSVKASVIKEDSSTTYQYNPNYITYEQGYRLGIPVKLLDRLINYRSTGKYVNSNEQFQHVTGIEDSLMDQLKPQLKYPEWIKKGKLTEKKNKQLKKKIFKIQDLNQVTVKELQRINGIGVKLSNRIVNFRNKLGGFAVNEQVYEVWYLDEAVANKILESYRVLTPPSITKINVNSASFKEILSIVYIDYELTKKIVNYRDEVVKIQSLENLKKIDGFPLDKYDRIALYLEAE